MKKKELKFYECGKHKFWCLNNGKSKEEIIEGWEKNDTGLSYEEMREIYRSRAFRKKVEPREQWNFLNTMLERKEFEERARRRQALSKRVKDVSQVQG